MSTDENHFKEMYRDFPRKEYSKKDIGSPVNLRHRFEKINAMTADLAQLNKSAPQPHIYVDARVPAELSATREGFVSSRNRVVGPAFYGPLEFEGKRFLGLNLPLRFPDYLGFLETLSIEGNVLISDHAEIERIFQETGVKSDRKLEGMRVTTWSHPTFNGIAGVSNFVHWMSDAEILRKLDLRRRVNLKGDYIIEKLKSNKYYIEEMRPNKRHISDDPTLDCKY